MSWLIFALLAPAVYTISNFIDKYVVEHKIPDARGVPVYTALGAAMIGTVLWVATGLPVLTSQNALLVVAAGAITMFGIFLYLLALIKTQTSLVIALFQTIPLFTLVLSTIFLHEQVSAIQLVGFFLILGSAIGLALEKSDEKFRLSSAFYYMLGSALLWAISYILIKFTVDLNDFVPLVVYESWGLAIGGVVLFAAMPSVRRSFFVSAKTVGVKVLGAMLVNEILFVCAKTLTFMAVALGPVALVTVLGSTQVFYSILYGAVLTLLLPRLFHEDLTRKTLAKKIILSAILFVGVALIGGS